MSVVPDRPERRESPRIPQRAWIGLAVVAVYVLLAAGLGNAMDVFIPTDDPTAELAASHFIPLTIGILLLLGFVRWSRWSHIWTNRSTLQDRPRRWWLLAIPVLMILLAVSQLPGSPWGERGPSGVLIVLAATLMVGFGEER